MPEVERRNRLTVTAGAEEPRAPGRDFDAGAGVLDFPGAVEVPRPAADPRELRDLIPARAPGRALDDWGRSERMFSLLDPLLDFYYRYWFRVEQQGVEHVPSEGGALLVSNHSGALPPDAPMIIRPLGTSTRARGRSTCWASTGSRATRWWGC